MVKATKNRKNLFLFFKILLFLAVAILCYFQFSKIKFTKSIDEIELNLYPFIGMVLLLPMNYFFEWKKWRSVLNTIDTDLGSRTNFQAFMAGIVTGMLTPNMQGNFLGRMYYFPRRFRLNIILLTFWTNIGQFLIALIFGIISCSLIGVSVSQKMNDQFLVPLIVIVVIVAIIYFTVEKWNIGLRRFKFIRRFQGLIDNHQWFRLEVLLWGTLRYVVFSIQFWLSLIAFGGEPSLELILLVWQIYLWSTAAPSLILGKLFVRESIALWVLGGVGMGEMNIVFASLSIWVINLLIPTFIGIGVCKRETVKE